MSKKNPFFSTVLQPERIDYVQYGTVHVYENYGIASTNQSASPLPTVTGNLLIWVVLFDCEFRVSPFA